MCSAHVLNLDNTQEWTLEPPNLLTTARDYIASQIIVPRPSQYHVHFQSDESYASLALDAIERFKMQHFEEIVYDDVANTLFNQSMVLKCQKDTTGCMKWTLNYDRQSHTFNNKNIISYAQIEGTCNMLAFLNTHFLGKSNWIPLEDEGDFALRFPCIQVSLYCIRIDSEEWCENSERVYVEIIQIAFNVFYTLTTYIIDTPLENKHEKRIVSEGLLSKTMASLVYHNPSLFECYFVASINLPHFQSMSPLSNLFNEMAKQFSALDEKNYYF